MYAELARTCRVCNKLKPNEEFYLNGYRKKNGKSAPRTDCKECTNEIHRQYVAKRKDDINRRRRENYRSNKYGLKDRIAMTGVRRRYGLRHGEYDEILAKQNNMCGMCGIRQEDSLRRFAVDHDHQTNEVRGLLCINCNRGLGLLQDSELILQSGISWLKKGKN